MIRTPVLFLLRLGRHLFYNTSVHRSRIVSLVYDRLFHLAFPRGDVIRVEFQGASFFLPSDDITVAPTVISGQYEEVEFRLLRRLLRPGMTFADVGANIGLHSVLAARAVTSSGHVYSFEPEPHNYTLLLRNLEANRCGNVTCSQTAVGATTGVVPLHLAGGGKIGTHSLLAPKVKATTVAVPVVSLDEYFHGRERQPDVLKIDVEGYEGEVLKGATGLLGGIELAFIEFNRDQLEDAAGLEGFANLLAAFPYLYRLNERGLELTRVSVGDLRKTVYANLVAARRPISI